MSPNGGGGTGNGNGGFVSPGPVIVNPLPPQPIVQPMASFPEADEGRVRVSIDMLFSRSECSECIESMLSGFVFVLDERIFLNMRTFFVLSKISLSIREFLKYKILIVIKLKCSFFY